MKFIPYAPTLAPVIETLTTPNIQSSSATLAHISQVHANLPEDFVSSDHFDGFASYIKVPTSTQPLCVPDARQCVQLLKMEKQPPRQAILQFEIWYQRMAHCSAPKLRQTQKCVDGIPPFARIPSIVRRRACDIATLKRAPRGPNTDDVNLEPGQVFQMDIGFFRGPRNLQEVYDRTADPQPKLIESRQGFVCYLLIIDRATRYIWVFPLRSKSINPDLIDLFLRTHGN